MSTTSFHTYVANADTRNPLAQRGHNKHGRHHLRQVGLSYVPDAEHGLSLCHHVYPGNVADAGEFPATLRRMVALLDRHGRDRPSVMLPYKGAALANRLELEQAGVGWITALP